MGDHQLSLSDRFVHVMSQIQVMDEDVDKENPHQYPLRKMKHTAEKVIFDALTTAQEVVETARVLKREIRRMDLEKTQNADG